MLNTIDLLGVKVSRVNLSTAKDQICQWVREKERVYVCVAPASTLVEARKDIQYRGVVNHAAMVTPDGMPVVWLAKMKGCQDIARTYGPDLMRLLCQQPGLKHYFFGSTTEVIRRLDEKLRAQNPNILIVGKQSPEYKPQVQMEDEATIKAINDAQADILWVGLGSPKQDLWMFLHRPRLNASVIIGVGAAFDFLSGVKPQAPGWMQCCGLEWFFRLCCEPGRLWKRYLVGNTKFIYFAIEDLLKKRS